MSEWKKVKLGDICDSQYGYTASTIEENTGTKFLRITDIVPNQIDWDAVPFCKISNKERDKYILHKGDIVVARTGATVGYAKYIKQDVQSVFASYLVRFVVKREDVFSQYVGYCVESSLFKDYINSIANGSAQPNANSQMMSSFELKIPPLPTQHRIATILSRYDTLIENYQKQIKLLEEAAQRLYKEWFVDLRFPGHENTKMVDGLPEGWERKKLVDMVDVQYGYAFDGMLFNSDGDGMPILRIRNIPDGTTSDFTTEEAPANYIVHSGDIVVGMDGIFHINSWSGGDAYLVQRACSFRPKEEGIKGFIFQAIQEPIKFFEKTLVGATVAHLGKKHIDSIELVVPNNHKFFEAFQTMYIKRQGLLSQIRLLTEARDRLLPRLMGGEMEVK